MIEENNRLQTQMVIAMVFTAIISLSIFIIGMAFFYAHLQNSWVNSLSAENQKTLNQLIAGGEVDETSFTTLISVISQAWIDNHSRQELFSLIFLATLSIIAAWYVGIKFAKKLSLSIETLKDAANEVAEGSANIHVDESFTTSHEVQALFSSFNRMTKSLAHAERESTESAAAIAHELRTPLTVLKGRLQGILDGAFSPTNEILSALLLQVDTLTNIVSDLDSISKLRAGRVHLALEPIDLALQIQTVLTSMKPDISKLGIVLEQSLSPAWVNADAARIRQAMNGIVSNTLKYAACGKYLKMQCFAKDDQAHIIITDHGPGIAEPDRERVFDRWWTGSHARSRTTRGSGLGLSIVKEIVHAHNGTISIESIPGMHGCMIYIKLPIDRPCLSARLD